MVDLEWNAPTGAVPFRRESDLVTECLRQIRLCECLEDRVARQGDGRKERRARAIADSRLQGASSRQTTRVFVLRWAFSLRPCRNYTSPNDRGSDRP